MALVGTVVYIMWYWTVWKDLIGWNEKATVNATLLHFPCKVVRLICSLQPFVMLQQGERRRVSLLVKNFLYAQITLRPHSRHSALSIPV